LPPSRPASARRPCTPRPARCSARRPGAPDATWPAGSCRRPGRPPRTPGAVDRLRPPWDECEPARPPCPRERWAWAAAVGQNRPVREMGAAATSNRAEPRGFPAFPGWHRLRRGWAAVTAFFAVLGALYAGSGAWSIVTGHPWAGLWTLVGVAWAYWLGI